MNSKIIHTETVKQMTRKDPNLSMVLRFVQIGWPSTCPTDAVKPFYKRKAEIQDGCILWGQRVVLPPQARRYALQMLHQTHPSICRMKSLARSYIWWPSMDSDVEQIAHNCNECSSNLKSPAKSPLHPWEWPSQPWFCIHLDYAGPFMGKMFLIIVDAHSKWIDVHPTSSSTSEITIEKLRITYANLGLPHQIVTDNGSCFTSTEFQNFTTANVIKHIFTAPYHASSNGLAERAVQSFKPSMRKQTGGTVQIANLISKLNFYKLIPYPMDNC